MLEWCLRARLTTLAEIQASKERLVDFLSVVETVVRDVVRGPRDPGEIVHSKWGSYVRHKRGCEAETREVARGVGFADEINCRYEHATVQRVLHT